MSRSKTGGRRFLRVLLVLLIAVAIAELLLFLFADDLFRLYYRKDFVPYVEQSAAEFGVPEELVYAVILRESGFRPDAVSSAGAKGLMQMRDVSFEEMRGRMGLTGEGDIFDPEQNIRCGTYCLSYLYRYFGNWETALAAYNAGIGNVQDWLRDSRYSADGKTLTDVPFPQTAAYIRNVTRAQRAYAALYGGK